jgi:hypothetical protein
MIEMAKAMIAAEHGVMPEMDDMDAELQDGLKDSGIDVLGVWGDMNPNAVTKDETNDDVCITEPEVTVMTKDGTWGGDFVCSEMNFVKQCSVEESISGGCTLSDGEPGMRVFFTKESTICVSESMWIRSLISDILGFLCCIHILNYCFLSEQVHQEALMETKNYMTDEMEHQAVVASPKMSTMRIGSTVVVQVCCCVLCIC